MDDPSKSQAHSRKMLYPQKSETLVDHHEVSPSNHDKVHHMKSTLASSHRNNLGEASASTP